MNDPVLFQLVRISQINAHSRICWKYNKNKSRFFYCCYFNEKTVIAKPIHSKFSNEERQTSIKWSTVLLSQGKSYIDKNLYLEKGVTQILDVL